MTWQILERASCIQITLLKAVADLDAGSFYSKQKIALLGQDLTEDWLILMAQATSVHSLVWLGCPCSRE